MNNPTDLPRPDDLGNTAVSLYSQNDAMDDFPVLKAFQQYIDNEQSKARRRLVTLCAFFGVLMVVVIAVFMFMMFHVSSRNDALSDKLLNYVMSQNGQAATANGGDTAKLLAALTQQLGGGAAPAAAPVPAAVDPRLKAIEDERIRMEQEKLELERRALAEEKERLHREEVERNRRRLYPEQYAEKSAATPAPAAAPAPAAPATPPPAPAKVAPQQVTDADIAEILKEAGPSEFDDDEVDSFANEPVKRTVTEDEDDEEEDEEEPPEDVKPVRRVRPDFYDGSRFEIPVDVKGRATAWDISVE